MRFARQLLRPLAVLALLCVACEVHAAPRYKFVDLGEFHPDDINDHGQIVGVMPPRHISTDVGLLQPDATTPTRLEFGEFVGKVLINNAGQIVNVGPNVSAAEFAHKAWTPEKPNSSTGSCWLARYVAGSLDYLEGHGASDLGDDGTLLVNGWDFSGGGTRSFIWRPVSSNSSQGEMSIFGGGDGATVSIACINRRGDIAGVDDKGAFVFIPETPQGLKGTRHTLSDDPIGARSSVAAINDHGQVVGSIKVEDRYHAMSWTPKVRNGTTGAMQDLGLLPGKLQSFCVDVNNEGVVVGVANDNGWFQWSMVAEQRGAAFVWTSADGMQNLRDRVEALDAGWSLFTVKGINDRGQIIGVGAYDPDGQFGAPAELRGYLLNPIPSTAEE